MRLGVNLRPDGGADVLIKALDKDAATAMTASFDAASVREVPMLGHVRLFDPVEFRAEGEHVRATARVNAAQVREMVGFAAAMLD